MSAIPATAHPDPRQRQQYKIQLPEVTLRTRSTHGFALVTEFFTESPRIAGYAASTGPRVQQRAHRMGATILFIEPTGATTSKVVVPARTVQVWR